MTRSIRSLLLVEDDPIKLERLQSFLMDLPFSVETARSYQTGLRQLMTRKYDVLLLDMSLPVYDISYGEDGFAFDPFAGKAILEELARKGVEIAVIVVTQFVTFGSGSEATTLANLEALLRKSFPRLYRGAVFYRSGDRGWMVDLSTLLEDV